MHAHKVDLTTVKLTAHQAQDQWMDDFYTLCHPEDAADGEDAPAPSDPQAVATLPSKLQWAVKAATAVPASGPPVLPPADADVWPPELTYDLLPVVSRVKLLYYLCCWRMDHLGSTERVKEINADGLVRAGAMVV